MNGANPCYVLAATDFRSPSMTFSVLQTLMPAAIDRVLSRPTLWEVLTPMCPKSTHLRRDQVVRRPARGDWRNGGSQHQSDLLRPMLFSSAVWSRCVPSTLPTQQDRSQALSASLIFAHHCRRKSIGFALQPANLDAPIGGWLKKQGEKGLIRRWRLRWFVLDPKL